MKILFFTLITIPFLIACSKPEYKNEHKINYKTIKNLSCQNLKATGILQLDTLKLDGKESSDRKSTRLNSSHLGITYAVFCLKNVEYSGTISQLY